MILSVSRRTDIPNYYSEWLEERFREGFLLVRNPINHHQVSRISLEPELIDGIVFWTKNPRNMFPRLEFFDRWPYYFQFTLTGYGCEIEPGLPDKKTVLIPAFQELADRIGSSRVIWRYDPIFLSSRYTVEYHEKAFGQIARELCGYTSRVVISFLDVYTKTKQNMAGIEFRLPSREEMYELGERLARTAKECGMEIVTCCEEMDLAPLGIRHGACIDRRLIEEMLGCRINGKKDIGQRSSCGCLESVEVGAYHTCRNGCRYCYANRSETMVKMMCGKYDPHSPFLCGKSEAEDIVTDRRMRSLKELQMSLELIPESREV